MDKIAILTAIGSVVLLVLIIELTRRRKIREQYALIWLTIGFLILGFSIFKKTLDWLARWAGIYYAPSLLIVLIVFFGVALGIHFTLVISKLAEDNKKLIQEIGLLKNKVENLEKNR
jgi:SNF family Na+-dependent transporter